MAKLVSNIILDAEVLLRKKFFQESLKELGEIDPDSVSPDERALYYLIFIEANLALGNYDCEEALIETLDYYRRHNDAEKLAQAKFLYGWFLISHGKFFDAREQLLESNIAFKRHNNYLWHGRALNRLSFVAYHIGEIQSAIHYLEECISLYRKHNDINNVFYISLNLAQLYFSLGSIADSISLYDRVEKHATSSSTKSACVFYFMSAIPRALKGDFDTAGQTIQKATAYLDGLTREQAIYYENLGWIHLLEEDYEQAELALQKGLEISLDIAPESALISQIKRRLADACIGLGRYDDARNFADRALQVAEKINERVEIAACHRVYARLAGRDGDAETARTWFKRATDLFGMIGSRYELAATRYYAAASGFYHNGEQQALLFLAKEYFASEKVTPFLRKIDAESNRRAARGGSHLLPSDNGAPAIVCRSRSMKRLVDLAKNVARSNMAVLLTGATGTGKDLFAKFIHYHSGRNGRFISVNAAAIPDNMVESELFGYRKGAYTGASESTSGWIEEADGGTFYLNEIADASPELQAKLLDVIENRRICRLGERRERTIDCRIIAASNHDLDRLINEGRFRLDLYHRLNEIPIDLPPLTERNDDIRCLVEYFLSLNGVTFDGHPDSELFDCLVDVFSHRQWPGNVRQLEIEVRRLALLCGRDLSCMVESAARYNPSEREELLTLLSQTGWNRREVARILGVNEATIRRRIKKHSLSANESNHK